MSEEADLRTRMRVATAIAALALVAAGCSGDGDGDAFGVVTWNAGLADGFVDYAAERTPPAAATVADLDADVVFVQEVWEPEAVAEVTEAAAGRFPNAFFLDPLPEEGGGAESPTVACAGDEAVPLEECARTAATSPPTSWPTAC